MDPQQAKMADQTNKVFKTKIPPNCTYIYFVEHTQDSKIVGSLKIPPGCTDLELFKSMPNLAEELVVEPWNYNWPKEDSSDDEEDSYQTEDLNDEESSDGEEPPDGEESPDDEGSPQADWMDYEESGTIGAGPSKSSERPSNDTPSEPSSVILMDELPPRRKIIPKSLKPGSKIESHVEPKDLFDGNS